MDRPALACPHSCASAASEEQGWAPSAKCTSSHTLLFHDLPSHPAPLWFGKPHPRSITPLLSPAVEEGKRGGEHEGQDLAHPSAVMPFCQEGFFWELPLARAHALRAIFNNDLLRLSGIFRIRHGTSGPSLQGRRGTEESVLLSALPFGVTQGRFSSIWIDRLGPPDHQEAHTEAAGSSSGCSLGSLSLLPVRGHLGGLILHRTTIFLSET